ncbi:MAG: universal stress protein [Acidimicrobiales bacterium]
MFDKLIVAVDSSPPSDRAVATARDLAGLSGGSVQLIHVVEHVAVPGGRFAGGFEVEDPNDAEQLLEKELATLKEAGVTVTANVVRARVGNTAQLIVDAASSDAADVIIMGCRGRSELTALVLGSTAFKVLHLADRPVLIVP